MKQQENGKAFEYAIGMAIEKAASASTKTVFVQDAEFVVSKRYFDKQSEEEQRKFSKSASLPLDTLFRLEPAICHPKSADDCLYIRFNTDAAGRAGDVRDVLLSRRNAKGEDIWEIGISAKNNHDAVKHSRLSPTVDFGREWFESACSSEYMAAIARVFAQVDKWKREGVTAWRELGETKEKRVYVPLLEAFKDEMTRLFREDQRRAAENLIKYLIGREPFYKVVKQDRNAMVVMKAFNFAPGLGMTYNGVRPDCRPAVIPMPSRMVELDFSEKRRGTQVNSVTLIMNRGWQVDFRIHSGDGPVVESMKFDIQLVGNPPVLFTQHVF